MKKLSEQIIDFNTDIESAITIKDLDFIYKRIVFSNINNATVVIFNHLINVKAENLILKGMIN